MPTQEQEPKSVADRLIELVSAATGDDLAALDDTIAAKEKELAALRKLRGVLSAGEEKAPRAVARQRRTATPAAASAPAAGVELTVGEARRMKSARYILKNGVTTQAALCRLFGIPAGSQSATFDHEWFEKTDAGLDLTPRGRAAVRGDGPND